MRGRSGWGGGECSPEGKCVLFFEESLMDDGIGTEGTVDWEWEKEESLEERLESWPLASVG